MFDICNSFFLVIEVHPYGLLERQHRSLLSINDWSRTDVMFLVKILSSAIIPFASMTHISAQSARKDWLKIVDCYFRIGSSPPSAVVTDTSIKLD